MADAQDPKVSSAYRELGAEEPPQALDQAILAAARRPRASTRPWTQRYAVPLGLAAVLVLSVTVTLRIQQEQPGIESIARQEPAAGVPTAPAAAPEAALKLKPEFQIKQVEPARARAAARTERGEPKPFPAQAPAAPAPASADMLASRADAGRSADSTIRGMSERQAEERTTRDAEAALRAHQAGALLAKQRPDRPATAPAVAAAAPAAAPAAEQPAKAAEQAQVAGAASQAARVPADTPEREFERIAQLRAEGRHDEADKAFLEFRRRYPDFRLSEEMLKRVLRR